MLKTTPAVFAVGRSYQIMVQLTQPALFWVRVSHTDYYDESNGILCSLSEVHRVTVPMDQLDQAREYTVFVRPLVERKPYYAETSAPLSYSYPFTPVPSGPIRAYHIADAHNRLEEPIAAARAFGDIDFLILNGDIINHSGDPSKFDNVYQLCEALTGGTKPVVFSRGNHDMRGNYAERFADYTPNFNGNTYYTFRLGRLWGVLLDCGEDKLDDHPEYGYTVACHPFRMRQTQFLTSVIADCKNEYDDETIQTRVVIAHNPFPIIPEPPFDIEQDIYGQWVHLLRDHIHPHVIICGHTHKPDVFEPGSEQDAYGQPCPVVTGSAVENDYFAGCGYIFGETEIQIQFTDNTGNRFGSYRIPITI